MGSEMCIRDRISPTNWSDSYSVDGQCYCDSSYDHGLRNVFVDTPDGRMSVPDVCAAINDRFGNGRQTGRTYFNTVQCGHPPLNNANDERVCPGIPRGRGNYTGDRCDESGATWNLNAVFGNQQPAPEDVDPSTEPDSVTPDEPAGEPALPEPEQPEQPEQEQPLPERPEPELPEPEQQEPEQPEPERPEFEQPEPEQPEPEQTEPEQPEQPEPAQPEPEQPEPAQPEPEQPEPENPETSPPEEPDSPLNDDTTEPETGETDTPASGGEQSGNGDSNTADSATPVALEDIVSFALCRPGTQTDATAYGWQDNQTCVTSMLADSNPYIALSTLNSAGSTPGEPIASADPDTAGTAGNADPEQISTTLPQCVSNNADPDGDGYGWENNGSCVVAVSPAAGDQAQANLPAICDSLESDSDGDGYGWENNATCLVVVDHSTPQDTGSAGNSPDASVNPPGDSQGQQNESSTSDPFAAPPLCKNEKPADSSTDYGWEDGASCLYPSAAAVVNFERPPLCSSSDADPDGNSYGWENGATCYVAPAQ